MTAVYVEYQIFLFFSVAETMKKVISDMSLEKPGQEELWSSLKILYFIVLTYKRCLKE